MLTKLINYIQNTKISITQWVIGFIGILFIRFILENISSQNNMGYLTADYSTWLHYSLFYLSLLLSIVICLKIFIPLKISDLTKLALFILPIIWLAPLLDLILSCGQVINMSYHFETGVNLFYDYLTFFGDKNTGITMGIRIELGLILLGSLILIYKYSKNIVRLFLACILIYSIFFIWLSFPSVILLINNIISQNQTDAYVYIVEKAENSLLNHNRLMPSIKILENVRNNEMIFNQAMIQIYLIINTLLLLIWGWIISKKNLFIILKNSRPRRLVFYLTFIAIGVVIAIKNYSPNIVWDWFDVNPFICLLIAYYCAWMFSVGINDLADKPIDRISNIQRPLIKNDMSENLFQDYNLIFLLISLIAGIAIGPYALYFIITFIMAYYIYSAPPLRLKRYLIISTFLIAIAALSVAMSSFYLISPDKTINSFPREIIFLIILLVTLLANAKDLKDYQGDSAENIKTLPTLLGHVKAKKIIALATAMAFLIIPLVLKNYIMFIPAIIFALISFFVINRNNFTEKDIFFLYFSYITIILILY